MPDITWSCGYSRNDDAAVYYEVHQSSQKGAPVLVLLHGNNEDMHVFDGRFEHLLGEYTVVTVDTRAHGKSSPGTRKLSYGLFAEDLFTLVNKLQIGRFLLLGFSDGAITALEFALRHQERLCAMVLIGANIDPEGLTRSTRSSLMLMARTGGVGRLVSKGRMPKRELLDLMLKQPHIDPQQLQRVRTPALIITGEKDMVRDEHTQLIADSLPQSRWEIIPKASHFVMADAPEQFDRLVYDFLMEE